jgi:hypothetical protein
MSLEFDRHTDRPASIAPTPGDAALMILRRCCGLIACWMGQGLLVPKHRAEIAHVKPAFGRVK